MPKKEVFDKNVVLNKAQEIFHKKGYNATSMQDLVDATGLNRSSIYNSFESKLELYKLCLNKYEFFYIEKLGAVLKKHKYGFDKIESLFLLYLDEIVKDKDRKGCLIVNCKSEMAHNNTSIDSFLFNNQKNTIAFFTDLVEEGQNDASINKNQTAEAYALFLYSAIQGFRMTGILNQNKNELKQILQITLKTLI